MKSKKETFLLLAYGDDGTEFLILNADDVASGPIFRPPLSDVFPYSFYDYFQKPAKS